MAPPELWRPGPGHGGDAGGLAAVAASAERYAGSLLLHGARIARELPRVDGAEQQESPRRLVQQRHQQAAGRLG
ncbi:hypothetical protein GDO81_018275 [Engystomops pustulosus]|uniref:Uncharacterized protein n=1 Tax=Engystomops pustulosus TaxID=76066 RepID=A0AAV7A880_ENGPU|nr:hypothetical protein GDO81_018275 [Engystomops pustulosus]